MNDVILGGLAVTTSLGIESQSDSCGAWPGDGVPSLVSSTGQHGLAQPALTQGSLDMASALDAFTEALTGRVNAYWQWCDDSDLWSSVENEFGWAGDWDDSKEGAMSLWRQAGWSPDLLLPRPTLRDPRTDDNFRSSVELDDFTTDYWFSFSTAIFFGTVDWGSWRNENVTVMPSLGQTSQYASGLLGAFSIGLIDPRPQLYRTIDGKSFPQVWHYVDEGWDPAGTRPIWDLVARTAHNRAPTRNEIPNYYQSNFELSDHGFDDLDDFLVFVLPEDLRSPHAMPLMSVVSYTLGWLALTYGLKVVVDDWQGINEVLTSAPLQGFAPAT